MKEKGILGNLHPFGRILLLVILSLGSLLLVTVIGIMIAIPFWGRELMEMLISGRGAEVMAELKYAQFLQVLTHLGLFIVPSIIFAWLVGRNPMKYLQGNQAPFFRSLILGALIMFAALPMVSLLMEINMRMSLPEFLAPLEQWMRTAEEAAAQATKTFLNVETWQGLLFNIFMIAVIPAIGEEFIFRGILQKTFTQWSGSAHLAVWVTAIIFSSMHMQFFGFLPRLMLGLLLGYMMLMTGNIWIPVVAHFFNNALAVILYFLYFNKYTSFDMEHFGEELTKHEGLYLLAFASLAIVTFLFWMLHDGEKRLGARSTIY